MKKPADAVAADAGFFEVHQEVSSMQSNDKAYPDSFPIASGDPAGSISHLLHLLDRPIAFHRCFVTLTGSVTAALMLSQALYWQRRCKDPEGWWYKTRDDWAEETGLSRYEQEGARKRLRKLGVMQEHLRGVPATIWYRVNEERLLEGLSKVAQRKTSNPVPVGGKPAIQLVENQPTGRRKNHQLVGGKPPNKLAGFAPTFKGTETTTETTTEITTTTPNPSSTDERTAEPEAVERGGVRDENQDRDGDHGIAALEVIEEQPASDEEAANEQRPELTYPAKLTEREREDIAAQVEPLPPQVAQQMLDVIASKMQGAQIRTNPAAVLRGIVRKYRADPESFDPSAGFQVSDIRRRREDARARQRAEAERREREAARASPAAREVMHRSIAAMKQMLRGHA